MGYISITAAALSAFVLGGWWYSPGGFLPAWKREQIASSRDLVKLEKRGGGHSSMTWVLAMVASFVSATALDWLVTRLGASNPGEGAKLGAIVGAFFVVPSFTINYSFGGNTLGLLALDGAYHVLQFAFYGALLASPLRAFA
jgi:hypothetical protein